MGAVVKQGVQLPTTAGELHEFVLVNQQALKAHKAKIAALRLVPKAQAAKDAAIQDAQNLGEVVLMAEARLGELLSKVKPRGNTLTSRGGRKATLPRGITYKQSHKAQEVAKNPEIVEEVIEECREKGEVPTERKVLGKIQARKKKPQTPKQKEQKRVKRALAENAKREEMTPDFRAAFEEFRDQVAEAVREKYKGGTTREAIVDSLDELEGLIS